MKLVTYANGDQIGVGVQREGRVVFTGYTDMLDLIRDGERGLERARAALKSGKAVAYDRLLAPIPKPGKIFGCGVNYRSHGDEEPGFVFPDEPAIDFVKVSSAVVGPEADIVIPPNDRIIKRSNFNVDYEVELGVVFSKTAKNVGRDKALEYVFGYTLFNDVGARAVQFKNKQVDLGKGFDTFSPMGPCIVTRDEIPDPASVHIQSVVNGDLRQDARGSDMINSVPVLIEWITSVITCEAGDCISTGTPAGCGTFMKPPAFLKPGDVVTIREDTIGELTNRVTAG
ncbi:MAG TPA: fumarylacetoacetate hydrolase family protein [Bauldia sp.]|nr:fumarylacetoacetate hydrolase family protein [Bauldia sp.]